MFHMLEPAFEQPKPQGDFLGEATKEAFIEARLANPERQAQVAEIGALDSISREQIDKGRKWLLGGLAVSGFGVLADSFNTPVLPAEVIALSGYAGMLKGVVHTGNGIITKLRALRKADKVTLFDQLSALNYHASQRQYPEVD